MQAIALQAELRKDSHRGETRRIRKHGDIPAVIYGRQQTPMSIVIDGMQFRKLHVGNHGLVQLIVPGSGEIHAMIKQVQTDPIKREVTHIDFHAVSLSEPVEAEVAILLDGLEAVEKRGGIIQQQVRAISIRCLPTNVPEHILLNISQLDIGDRLLCSDIPIPANVELRSDPDEVVVNVVSTRAGDTGQEPEDATPGVLEDRENKGVDSDGLETPNKA